MKNKIFDMHNGFSGAPSTPCLNPSPIDILSLDCMSVLCQAQFVQSDTHLLVGHSWWSKYIRFQLVAEADEDIEVP